MKRVSFCLAILLLLSFGSAFAQPPGNTFTKLGTVTPQVGTDSIQAGVIVSFPLIYGNRDTNVYNPSNAFLIYSDTTMAGTSRGSGTATWAHAIGDGGNFKAFSPDVFGLWVDTTGFYHKSDFGGLYKFNCFNCDGAGVDTLAFVGAPIDAAELGAHPLDSGVFFIVKILTKLADTGKIICIDSTAKWQPSNVWKWASFNYQPPFNTFPTWSGPHCFRISKPAPADVREVDGGGLPDKFELAQNYPNPFNPTTTIRFDLPKKSSVKLTIYNVLGQQVSTLFDGEQPAGKYEATWDGTSQTGVKVSSGTYFYKLEADGFVSTKKMLLLK
jgi:hypothetical protein